QAFDILEQTPASRQRVLIAIDSNADTELPFEKRGVRSELDVGLSSLFKVGFPARSRAFERTFKSLADALKAQTIILDFAVAANLESKAAELGLPLDELLSDLPILRKHAA